MTKVEYSQTSRWGTPGTYSDYDTRAIIAMLVMEVQRLNTEIERLRGEPCPPGHIAGV